MNLLSSSRSGWRRRWKRPCRTYSLNTTPSGCNSRRSEHHPAEECGWKCISVLMCSLRDQAVVVVEDKERLLMELQKKVASLERRLQGDLSQDEHLQELLQEVTQLQSSSIGFSLTFGVTPVHVPKIVWFHFKPKRSPAWRRIWRRVEQSFWLSGRAMQTPSALWRLR